ncbi:MAG: hypothetical protein ABGW87_03195 [Sphingomonadaceae bacterium]
MVARSDEMKRSTYWFEKPGLGCLLLLFVIVAAGLTLLWRFDEPVGDRSGTVEEVTITGFGAGTDQYQPTEVFVSFEDKQGLVGGTNVDLSDISNCKVGDKMRARRTGILLDLIPAACRTEPASRKQ